MLALINRFTCSNLNLNTRLLSWKMLNVDPRNQYKTEKDAFTEDKLVSRNPYKQFESWFDEACNHPDIVEPNAMVLATVKKNKRPTARMVLMKGFDEDGFRFYTNYRSNKASELEDNPYAALVFYWFELNRSVRVEGRVEKLSKEVSEEYFSRRPRPSQFAAHVSQHQSSPISSREVLNQRELELEKVYPDGEPVPKPDFWGGYFVKPDLIEFWQGHATRICDRIVFTRKANISDNFLKQGEDGWIYQRLEP
ncbi:pyridoxine/pyridoxamine 5'-phosphate oxidase-like [Clavelina lepadiformis]|uniref:pyridoxal 5'-phosphate synthase n=1 Tax=Clavelina lepadiformis TaxID=159417 RepID=A0ABP0FEM6_CLALP